MSCINSNILAGASGSAGGGPLSVDDVFGTFLYEGTGSTQTITNGIDLAGEGGLVWVKCRTAAENNILVDTERGVSGYALISNSSAGTYATTNTVTAFNSNGFTVGPNGATGSNNEDYVAWSFRKAPGFFDVVTWSGTNTNRNIPHNLESVPGMVIVKRTDASDAWYVYHRSTGATKYLELNLTGGGHTSSATWNNTAPTSSVFTVGSFLNATGGTYVAYVFAHDEPVFGTDEDESIIKCGTFTSSSFTTNVDINLGFEPQFFLVKKSGASGDWWMIDTMRGFHADGGNGPQNAPLRAESSNQEGAEEYWRPTATGISGFPSGSNDTYIYMAIRRPNKPPTAGTEVYKTLQNNTTLINGTVVDFGFTPDMHIASRTTTGMAHWITSRHTGGRYMFTSSASNEGGAKSSYNKGQTTVEYTGTAANDSGTYLHHGFRRTPGFFDVVTYSGTGSATAYNHNLSVKPDLKILKSRTTSQAWKVGFKEPSRKSIDLNYDDGMSSSGYFDAEDTATTFYAKGGHSESGASGVNYIAYLFATLPGVSKVGSYSGTGSALDINCGFTAGARFILIKRTNSSGDWYVWDSVRGIVSGNDPYLQLNNADNQVTNTDYVDPLSTGFTVTSSAPAALNASGGTYLFLAIA